MAVVAAVVLDAIRTAAQRFFGAGGLWGTATATSDFCSVTRGAYATDTNHHMLLFLIFAGQGATRGRAASGTAQRTLLTEADFMDAARRATRCSPFL